MAFVLKDRVKETSTTTGTGTFSLDGAVSGFQGFVAAIGNGNACFYCIVNRSANEWEVGLGTVTDGSPDTLTRVTVYESSNSGSLVNFSSGTKDVFVTYPAEKAAVQEQSVGFSAVSTSSLTSDNLRLSDAVDQSHHIVITSGFSDNLTADRTFQLVVGNANRVLTVSGDATIANWFDQSVKTTASPQFGGLSLLASGEGLEVNISSAGGGSVELTAASGLETFSITTFAQVSINAPTSFQPDDSKASTANATWDGFNIVTDSTLSLTGSTNVTTAAGVNLVTIGRPRIASITVPLTVSRASTVYIENAPWDGGLGEGTTITNAYAVWIDDGTVRIDGSVILGSTATPQANDGAALGTGALSFSDLFLASGGVINFANGDVTLTHSADTLTLAGGTLVLPASGLQVGSSNPFSDSSGTLTLQNVDALDATTESTIEAAIDTLANLTSVQGHTVTLTGAFIRSGAHSLTLTTSGTTDVTLPTTGTLATLAGTETFSNKRITPRVGTTTSSATPTINTDNYDIYSLTAQAADITSFTTNLSGSPNNGDRLEIWIKATSSDRSITWGSSFEPRGYGLPTVAPAGLLLRAFFEYDTGNAKWGCIHVVCEHSTPAVVSSVSAASGDGNTVTTSNIDTTGATLLVLTITSQPATDAFVTTISDNKSNIWKPLTRAYNIGTGYQVQMFIADPATLTVGSGHNFTYTTTGTYPTISVVAASGNYRYPVLLTNNAQSGSATPTSIKPGKIHSVGAPALVVTGAIFPLGTSPSVSGYTALAYGLSGGANYGGGSAYQVVAGGVDIDPTWSWTTGTTSAALVVAFITK